MPRHPSYVPHGVIPAVLLPFENDLSIDEPNFRKHLRDVASVEGLSADHDQRAFDRGRLLQLRRAAPRARHRAGRDRRQAAAGQRHLGRRQPGSRAACPHGRARRRLRALGVSAGAVHARPVAGDGAGAFQAHRGGHRPAADRVPVSAGDRAGLSEGHAAQAVRGNPVDPRHQGLDRQRAASRLAHPHAAKPAAAGERAHHAFVVAVFLAGAGAERPAVRLGQRDRRLAGQAVPRGAGATIWRKPSVWPTASSRPRACSTPIRSSTCTTA